MGEVGSFDDEWEVQRFFYSYRGKIWGVECISNKLPFLGNKIYYENVIFAHVPHTTHFGGVERFPEKTMQWTVLFPVTSFIQLPYLRIFRNNAFVCVTTSSGYWVLSYLTTAFQLLMSYVA
jgi:hypothetical protein